MVIRMATEGDMPKIYDLRFEVFVVEQRVPREIELDGEDAHALHVIAEEGGVTIGCARVLLSPNEAHIGRLAVKREYRGMGIGSEICRFLVGYCRENSYGYIWLNSQLHALPFYKKLGFAPQGEIFEEADIRHMKMVMGQK